MDEATKLDVTAHDVARTQRTARIRMVDDEISMFVNGHGQQTPLLIVARCKLDGNEYGALFDCTTSKCYVVELVREKGEIKYFRDLDGANDDEEWAVISNYFLDNNVYERNRIINWIWNTRISAELGRGIPRTTIERWNKKKYKRRIS